MLAVLAAARFAHFAVITLLFGLAAFPFYAWREYRPSPFDRWLTGLAALALITGGLELAAMTANAGDSPGSAFDPQVVWAVASDTAFGRVWLARLLLAILILTLRLISRPPRDPVLLAASGLLLASVALTGHSAMPGGALGLAHRVADAVHLVAGGWWIGGLLALLLSARSLGEEAAAVLARFSGVGYGAVAAIAATGLFKSVILVAPISAGVATGYGRTLLAKLALFAGMGALAASNRFWITPALARGVDRRLWLRRLRLQVSLELALAIGVLAVVGALGAMQPPISG